MGAKLDCKYSVYVCPEGYIGSSIQQVEHYKCSLKNICITNPPFGWMDNVPYVEGDISSIKYTEEGLFCKKKTIELIRERIHPCDNCSSYVTS